MKIRNIVFSGFMASILMAGGAYAAVTEASLTTKGYVDAGIAYAVGQAGTKATAAQTAAQNYADTKKTEAIAAAKTAADAAYDAKGAAAAAETAAKNYADSQDTAKIGGITGTVKDYVDTAIEGVGGDTNALSAEIDALQGLVGETSVAAQITTALGDYTTTTDMNTELAKKANSADVYTKTAADAAFATKATTLAGYGITDAYTKTEVNTELENKVSVESGKGLVETTKVTAYDTHITDGDIHVTATQKTTWSGKQDAITSTNKLSHELVSGLGTAATTDSTAYATAAQGAKADSAIQRADLNAALEDYTTTANLKPAAKENCSANYCYISNTGALAPIDVANQWTDPTSSN